MKGDGQRAGWLLREVQFGKQMQSSTVVVKDLFQKVEGICSGETQIQTKSANTSILCHVFKQKPLFSLLSTLHRGSFGGRAPRYRLGLLHRSYPRVEQGKYSLDPGDRPQHAQLLHSQLIFTHPYMDGLLGA